MIPVYWWQLVALCVLVGWLSWVASMYYWAVIYGNEIVDAFEKKGADGVVDVARDYQRIRAQLPKFMGGRG